MSNESAALDYIAKAKAAARRVIGKRRGKFAFFYGMDGKTVFKVGKRDAGGYYLKSGKDQIFAGFAEIVLVIA